VGSLRPSAIPRFTAEETEVPGGQAFLPEVTQAVIAEPEQVDGF